MANRKSGSYEIKALGGNIEGLNELLQKLDMLPEEAAAAARDGIAKSANTIITYAKMRAIDPLIRASITGETEQAGAQVHAEVYVQATGHKTPLWPVYVEMGTGPKGIASAGEKYPLPASAYTQHPWWYYNERVGHVVQTSGRTAQPYLWPSYQAEKPYVLANVQDAVRDMLQAKGRGSK